MFMSAKTYTVTSPDKKIKMNILVDNQVSIQILNSEKVVLDYSSIDLTVNNRNLCVNPHITGTKKSSVNNTIVPVVKVKADRIEEAYNELIVMLKGGYSIIFRAYDLGVSYRFRTNLKTEQAIVNEEQLVLNIPASANGYLMQEKSFSSMSESPYVCKQINAYENNSLYSLPALFRTENNDFLLITESDIYDYPGLWLSYENGLFKGVLPQKVTQTKEGSCLGELSITKRAAYLAETSGKRAYPWRVFVITDAESKLITNQLVYLLGSPAPESDYSWIQPGLATLDWWGRRNIFGTDFKGGVNTETHKYFVDFNNNYGLSYFVLDDGWSDACDLKKINPNLDLDELSAYAKQKNIGLVFWVHAFALKQDIPGYLDFFKSKGAAGIKVDFIARDDQDAINLFHNIAREALKRELVIDFHGVCKPFGMNRTYPNVLTSEGLIEFEMNGVTDWANPQHHTLLPFIRMVAGPMDYLPGTMNNAQKNEFYMYGNRPVGLGTRSHSMALSVIFESPLTMLPDSPSDYLKEDECTRFLSQIPVVWDETLVLDAKIGAYVVLARRNGDNWFIGAITNWEARDITVNLDFLGDGTYKLECFKDGENSETRAIDYKVEKKTVNAQSTIRIPLTTGGGWAGKISGL
jgi:alpha-glucosidase